MTLRLGEALRRWLDLNSDGKLTQAELRRAPELLRKLDLNEDEFLDQAELLASAPPARSSGKPQVRLAEAGPPVDALLRMNLAGKGSQATLEGVGAGSLRLTVAPSANGLYRLYGLERRWSVCFRSVRTVPDVRSAGEFLAAQFRAALGDQEALPRTAVEQDPALGGLLELFPCADRNGDNRLSLAELESYLDLIDRGVRSQVWIKVTERARNPFHFLDTNGDGRLSYRELTRAADLLGGGRTEEKDLPRQVQLSFSGSLAAFLGRREGPGPEHTTTARPHPTFSRPALASSDGPQRRRRRLTRRVYRAAGGL